MSIIYSICKKTVLMHWSKRSMFYWINVQFNIVDIERTKKFGPDRTCAEWILRNGGTIKWVNSDEHLIDYNELPVEGTVVHVEEINATNTGVMFNGFAHLKGCKYINKMILHKCDSMENSALGELHYIKESLKFLQVSSCPNVRDDGLMKLNVLTKLTELVMFDLQTENMNTVVAALKKSLPKCNIKLDD